MTTNDSVGKSVLFVTALAEPERGGGVEHTLWNLSKALSNNGYNCSILALDDKPGIRRQIVDGVTVWKAGATAGYWPWAGRESSPAGLVKRQIGHALTTFNPFIQTVLNSILQQQKPDLVSFHNLTGWSVASWKTVARAGIPVVQVLHDFLPVCFHSVMRREGRNCTSPCSHCRFRRLTTAPYSQYLTAVIGVSQYVLNRHLELGFFRGVPVKKVIHNVRMADTLGVGTLPSRTSRTGLRFGFIGRLDPSKGVEELIRALRDAGLPDAELSLAGSGPKCYEDLLKREGGEQVNLLGQVRPADFYPNVDVVVVPSLWNEVLGNVVYEALAFGKVVLAAKRGGIPEMINHDENGLLFDPENHSEFTLLLKRIAADEQLRARLSAAAPASAEYFLDENRWVAQYEEVYRSMLTIAHNQGTI